jgi:hypothetical protein
MIFQGQNAKKNQRKISILDQWVEIRIEDGITTTTLFPSNQDLLERGKEMDPPPDLVYRRLHFPDGVPSEYYWAVEDEELRKRGVFGTQRMTVDTWLRVIACEEAAKDGHIGMTGVGNLPRPKERGGCDCPVCTENQALLDSLET